MGFITDLPTSLVAAFRATLEEVLSADLILHVRDISHPDSEAQKHDVEAVLDELGIGAEQRAARLLEVWNKSDLLAAERARRTREAAAGRDGAILVSAIAGTGVAQLLELVDRRLAVTRAVIELDLDYAAGEVMAWLHRRGEVLETSDDGQRLHLKVAVGEAERAQLAECSAARSRGVTEGANHPRSSPRSSHVVPRRRSMPRGQAAWRRRSPATRSVGHRRRRR